MNQKNPAAPIPAPPAEAPPAEGRKSTPPRKKMGAIGKFYTKFACSVGIVEKTNLEPAFLSEMNRVEHYRQAVDKLLDGLEAIMQPDPRILNAPGALPAPGDVSWEQMARAVGRLHCLASTDKNESLLWVIFLMNKLGVAEREGFVRSEPFSIAQRVAVRKAIKRVRRFVTYDYDHMLKMVENLDICLLAVDSRRHEVKATKTAEQLEVNGKAYVKAIREFDKQACEIQEVIDAIPDLQRRHMRDVVAFFGAQEKYHRETAKLIREALKHVGAETLPSPPPET